MQRINGPNNVSALPGGINTAPGGYFSDTAKTTVTDQWCNEVQEEIVSVITAGGLTLDATNNGQLLAAINNLIENNFTGSFPSLLSQNGYQILPSGLYIQWGNASTITGYEDSFAFPIAFPNGCFSLVINERNASGWGGVGSAAPVVYGATFTLFSKTHCSISAARIQYPSGTPVYQGGLSFSYIAVGY